MPTPLLIPPDDILRLRGVESERVEFKARWSEAGPRSPAEQILYSICAFANDLHELNGGYVVVGVDAADGVARLPPRGLAPASPEEIQKRIRVLCRTKLEPEYQPRCAPARVAVWYMRGKPKRVQPGFAIRRRSWLRLKTWWRSMNSTPARMVRRTAGERRSAGISASALSPFTTPMKQV